ncbi:MAG: oxidoreductase [archaeon GW2011_AR10]|nr:MAG: oxidoreductase [archaeon GW2011_AR10]
MFIFRNLVILVVVIVPKKNLESLDIGYDIVVIGAGAAGCFLAKNISSNYKVLVVDSRSLPRHKACSGIVVRQGKELLEPFRPPESIFLKPKEIHIVYSDWTHKLEREIQKGFWNTDREKLDKWLYELALKKENVDIIDNAKLIDFNYAEDKKHIVVVLESNGGVKNIISNYLVGCDGALSTVRQVLGVKPPKRYVAIQELIKAKGVNKAYFIFDEEITDWYAWVIPKGEVIDVGAALDPFKAREKFAQFKEKVKQKFKISGKGFFDSAMLTRPQSVKDLVLGEKRVLLAGEAAGLISPSSGEGISFALRSAKFAANAFNKNFKDALSEYKKEAKPLVERLNNKFLKSTIISNKQKRINLMRE